MAENRMIVEQDEPIRMKAGEIIRAVSPTVDLERVEGGVEITVHDIRGDQTETVRDGDPGDPGVSPTVTVEDTETGHRVTITDAEGPHTFDVPNGDPGDPGEDGVSPTAAVTKSGKTATITITDKTGTTTATVSDGQDGDPGEDGISPAATVTKAGKVATITITDKSGTTTATVSDGQDGDPGDPGADGTTYTPSVSADGDLSWTNDGGKENPPTVNIKGPQGDPGEDYVLTAQDKADIAAIVFPDPVNVSGSTPTITAEEGRQYICGEVSTISITPPASGCCDIIFESGSTPAVLTVLATVKWPAWFDPTALEANATYEINILNGTLGAVGVWT